MEKFTLDLNILDRNTLQEVAEEKGFNNTRDFINHLVKEFPSQVDLTKISCKGKARKNKNIYDIPAEHNQFYELLSCKHSTTISGIIFRYVIFPEIAGKIIEKASNQ